MFASIIACFNQIASCTITTMTGGTNRIFVRMNDRASTTPGFTGRTGNVTGIRSVARRTFPTVYARCIRRVGTFATVFTAPTVVGRANIRF